MVGPRGEVDARRCGHGRGEGDISGFLGTLFLPSRCAVWVVRPRLWRMVTVYQWSRPPGGREVVRRPRCARRGGRCQGGQR